VTDVVPPHEPAPATVAAQLLRPHRTVSTWSSPRGIDTSLVPWRLWEKSKKLFWDPADIDFSVDAEQWRELPEAQRIAVGQLGRGFMVGEEGVTLDILPLSLAVADEGRLEEVIYLTSFALEEAKHVDLFRRWFDAVGADPDALVAAGPTPDGLGFDPDRSVGMFESELPRVMRRLLHDRSPEAILDASITYNQFVEGCLAISGYTIWGRMFASFGLLPGLQEGLRHVRADEGRHITYGTYLCQRLLAAHPELLGFAQGRLRSLRDWYLGAPDHADAGARHAEPGGSTVGSPGGPTGGDDLAVDWFSSFGRLVDEQVTRRLAVMARAVQLSEAEMIAGAEAEEVERQLSDAA
jgi:ribonucleoside-diphosphate reductase beta chain